MPGTSVPDPTVPGGPVPDPTADGPIPWSAPTPDALPTAQVPPVAGPGAVAPTATGAGRRPTAWKQFLAGSLVGALVGAGVAGGIYVATKNDSKTVTRTIVEPERTPAGTASNSTIASKPNDIQSILAKVEPAVVAIRTGSAASDLFGGGSSSDSGDSGDQGGAGSGFVVSPDGVIVTNNHVIEGANGKIEVAFTDGTLKKAKVLGHSSDYDLAVLKVNATNLPTAALGSSDSLQVGDDVVAIGNALALEGGLSVTQGIISAEGRTVDEPDGARLFGALQTDAAINPGNSGGPLVNASGQVVGINTALAGGSQNVGFAIAIDSAKDVIAALEKGQQVKTALLGVRTEMNSPAVAQHLHLKTTEGVVLVHDDSGPAVAKGSGADKAGLRENDVILSIDGQKMSSPDDVAGLVRRHEPGETVSVAINRGGKVMTVNVTLGTK
jgi:S1-C subfamily serine protease